MTYQPKQHTDGPDKHVFEDGSTLQVDDGATVTAAGTDYTGQEFADILAVVNAIPTSDQNDSVTIWNDGGVLKVSSAP